jgi:hypothetical protein
MDIAIAGQHADTIIAEEVARQDKMGETQAREKLRGDRSADGRGKGPRPAATYRGARKNAARDQH